MCRLLLVSPDLTGLQYILHTNVRPLLGYPLTALLSTETLQVCISEVYGVVEPADKRQRKGRS